MLDTGKPYESKGRKAKGANVQSHYASQLSKAEATILVKYIAVVEYYDRLTKTFSEIPFSCEEGKNPSIGDFIKIFQEQGLEMEIKDFETMTFQPIDKTSTDIVYARVTRAFKDYSNNDMKRKNL